MIRIFNFFGKMMASFYGIFDDMFGAIIVFCAIVYMVMTAINNKLINNFFISEIIEDEFKKTRKNASKDKKKADNSTMELLLSYGYGGFAGVLDFLLKSLLGVLMAFGIKAIESSSIDKMILNVNTEASLKQLNESGQNTTLVVILCIVTVFLQLLFDGYVEKHNLMDQGIIDIILLIPLICLCIFVPSSFVFFYISYLAIEFLLLYYQTKINHDRAMARFDKTLHYKKSNFERRYEEQLHAFNSNNKSKKKR